MIKSALSTHFMDHFRGLHEKNISTTSACQAARYLLSSHVVLYLQHYTPTSDCERLQLYYDKRKLYCFYRLTSYDSLVTRTIPDNDRILWVSLINFCSLWIREQRRKTNSTSTFQPILALGKSNEWTSSFSRVICHSSSYRIHRNSNWIVIILQGSTILST